MSRHAHPCNSNICKYFFLFCLWFFRSFHYLHILELQGWVCLNMSSFNPIIKLWRHGLSCVACWAGRNENQEWFSNGVISVAYMRWSCTVYDFLALGVIFEQEVVLLIRWCDCRIRIFKRLLLYNKINRKCTGRTTCKLWRKRSSIFLSACWHRYKY